MPKSTTWRTTGFEDQIGTALVVGATATNITGATPVKWPSASTGVDTSARGRKSILVVITALKTTAGVTFTVTESATTNGTYTACTVGTTPPLLEASGVQVVAVKPNAAKPFLRVTGTGDGETSDYNVAVAILYI